MEPQETAPQDPITTPNKPAVTMAAALVTCVAMIAVALIIIMHPASKTGTPTATTEQSGTPTSIPAEVATLRPSDMNHVRGDLSKAQVLIFEYSDSDCPYCQRFHPVLQQVVNDYQGKVAWVYRFYPLTSLHPDAYNEALALQCASQLGGAKAFNTYLDAAINVTLNPDPQSTTMLTTIATSQGLDATKFNSCMTDPATATTIQNSIQEAQAIGAAGTPFSVVVNIKTGKQIIIPGSYPIEDVKKDIDSLLQ